MSLSNFIYGVGNLLFQFDINIIWIEKYNNLGKFALRLFKTLKKSLVNILHKFLISELKDMNKADNLPKNVFPW